MSQFLGELVLMVMEGLELVIPAKGLVALPSLSLLWGTCGAGLPQGQSCGVLEGLSMLWWDKK